MPVCLWSDVRAACMQVTEESLEIRRLMLGARHADVAETLINLANVHESKGETQKALDRCKEALDIFVSNSGSDSVEVAQLHAQIGVLYRALFQDDLAVSHLKISVQIYQTVLGADHEETKDAQDILTTANTATPASPGLVPSTKLGLTASQPAPQKSLEESLQLGWGEANEPGATDAAIGKTATTAASPAEQENTDANTAH